MNAVSNFETNLTEGNPKSFTNKQSYSSDLYTIIMIFFSAAGSDTDELPEYYEPISNVDEQEDSSDNDNDQDLVNGCLENGISYLDLNNQQEEEEEERMREAVQRAFREDESRRRAPLTPENTVRVMEAMRGISLPGLAPDWAAGDRWMDELARIRRPASS